ncbi:MAG: AraC family transcriptional regulator [Bacteroidetes bacterium]|nr:AraC family transcriptional regulator [Bacteroidota bacterium]
MSYQLSIQTHKVSQAINRKAGLNFNDYINQFRSEYCKEKLMDENYTHYTIEALGKLSGFRSRQTLIKSFKKFYNKTPSEFLKRDT